MGSTVAQIAKSTVFRSSASNLQVLIITSGSNRVDPAKVAALNGQLIARANADFVREATGFAIGGVPPVGHVAAPPTLIDADLAKYHEIWAAAVMPNAVFRLTPEDLVRLAGGRVERIA